MNSGIDILFFVATQRYSGAEIVLERIVKESSKNSLYKPHIFCSNRKLFERIRPYCIDGFLIKECENLNWRSSPLSFFKLLHNVRRFRNELIQYLKCHNISVLHANSLDSAFYCSLLPKSLRPSLLWHHHNIFAKKSLERLVSKSIFSKFNRIVPVSFASAEAFKGVSKKVSVVYNGIDATHQFNPNSVVKGKLKSKIGCKKNVKLIGVVGQVHPTKGTHAALELIRYLVYELAKTDYHLVIVGDYKADNKYLNRLKKYIQNHNLYKHVSFTGIWDSIEEVYSDLDCLILPSVSAEALPTVVLEALSMGVLTIATPLGGTKEIIKDEINGLLFDVNHLEGFANHLDQTLRSPLKLAQIKQNARSTITEKFSFTNQFQELTNIYRDLSL